MKSLPLRLAFVVGTDNESTRLTIETVCRLPMVQPVAVLLDTGRPGWIRRVKNLRCNIRRKVGYVLYRLLAAARAVTDKLAYDAAASRQDVLDLLRKAFPERCFSLQELGRKFGFEVRGVGNAEPVLIQAKKNDGALAFKKATSPESRPLADA
jgi:hypothetical protein